MNNLFAAKLLQNLRNKKGNKGFTLIELLVVVIIIGVLAAVALPNLLAQVGKARETEGKTGVGTISRAQQSYHFESQAFASAITNAQFGDIADAANVLGIGVQSQYFDFTSDLGTAASVLQRADAKNSSKDGVRAYAGATTFDSGNYYSALCQNNQITDDALDVDATTDLKDPTCNNLAKKIK